jgi:hypothetical protein
MVTIRIAPWTILSCAAIAAASPFSLARSGGVTVRSACAQQQGGSCCPEERSVCFVNGVRVNDAFYLESGKCTPPPDQ